MKLSSGKLVTINYEGKYRKPYREIETIDISIAGIAVDLGWQEAELSVDIDGVTYSGIRTVLLVRADKKKS